jgi:hypothetical protein
LIGEKLSNYIVIFKENPKGDEPKKRLQKSQNVRDEIKFRQNLEK